MEQVIESGLVRGVRRWDVVALMINGIIGGSIFGLPSRLYALTGAYSASQTPLADASNRFIGVAGATVISTGVLVSVIGTLSGTLLTAPRLLFAMAEHGQIPQIVSKTHRSFHTPHVAIALTAVISLAIGLSGTFIYLVTINGITKLILFATVCVVLLALRRRENERPAAFRLPSGKVIAMIALIVCIWLLANVGWRELRDVAIALAKGLLLHFVYQWQRREKQFPRVLQEQQIRGI